MDRYDEERHEAASLDATALATAALRRWYERQPPGSGQDTHPDASDAPDLGAAFARAAARRRLDEQAERPPTGRGAQ